jgi:predicted PurR-regulated permease PerM
MRRPWKGGHAVGSPIRSSGHHKAVPERGISHVAYRAVLLAAGLLLLGLVLRQLITLSLAVMITVIVAIPLAACATRLERLGVPRPLGAAAGLFGGLAVIAGIVALIVPPFIDETNHFVNDLPATVSNLRGQIHKATGASRTEIGHRAQKLAQRYTKRPERVIGPLTTVGLGVAGVVAALILMLMTAYFMAARPEPLVKAALSLIPPDRRSFALHIMQRVRTAWIGWMAGTAVKTLIVGTLLYLGLSLAGLEFAVLFAVVTALLVVIPYFGGILGTIPAVLLAFTHSPGKALLVFGIYLAVLQLEGNVIIPVVMSKTVKLHPALIAIGVVVFGELFGFLGLLVSIPLLSLIVILVDELWVKPLERRHREASFRAAEFASGEVPPPPAAVQPPA